MPILNTFAHFSSETGGEAKYHQYPTSSSLLISSYEDFKKSRRRLRNLGDLAKQSSEKLRDKLNEKWSANIISPPGIPAETVDFMGGYSHSDKGREVPTNRILAEHATTNQNKTPIPAANVVAPPYAISSSNYKGDSLIPASAAASITISPNDPALHPVTPAQEGGV